MREIVLDTETTGLDPAAGHRLVEVACLELMHHLPSGRVFQRHLNPEREVPEEATRIHGLTGEFLADKPLFREVASALLAFIGEAPLVIHNAEFDLGFLNAELARIGGAPIARARAIDTVQLARRKFPGAPASLDALCSRFAIDNSGRDFHGARLDAELLCEVYLELIGGRQATMELAAKSPAGGPGPGGQATRRPARAPRGPSRQELAAHERFVAGLKNPIWTSDG